VWSWFIDMLISSRVMGSGQVFRRLLHYLRPYQATFAFAALFMLGAATSEPMFSAFMKLLLDQGFKGEARNIWLAPLIVIAIFFLRGICLFGATYLLSYVANRILMDLRAEMFSCLIRLPVSFYDLHPSAKIISKITSDVNNVGGAATHVVSVLVKDTMVVLGLVSYMLYLNWQLTLITLTIFPLIAWFARSLSRRLRHVSKGSQQAMGDMLQVLQETTEGQRVLKVYGGQAYESSRFEQTNQRLKGLMMRMSAAQSLSAPVTQLLAALALGAVIATAIYQSTLGLSTVGEFGAFMTAMLLLLPPLKSLADINVPLQRGIVAAESVFELLDTNQESDQGKQALARARGEIEFRQVSLLYSSAERPSLVCIDVHIQAGESVALVGPSGGGKTSLAHLLPRFYHPTSGQILLDGIPLSEWRLDNLRQQMALVSQEVVLFNDTVAANIAYGAQRSATRDQVVQAAQAAYLHDFILTLPQGYETMIGERGVRLSGGQRQRLAIARALLKNAPVLILDEATSALDSESERQVQMALERLMQNRTTLVIAHRLSTIENVDRILVLESGRLAEQGTHGQLLAQNGLYAHLYKLQQMKH
jgi:subfamily B ATP-binding cassette protein MsbA